MVLQGPFFSSSSFFFSLFFSAIRITDYRPVFIKGGSTLTKAGEFLGDGTQNVFI